MTPLAPQALSAIERSLTRDRLTSYLDACGGDLAQAIELYEWNSEVGSAFFDDLGVLEVVLRNACHAQLAQWNSAQGSIGPWYHHGVLSPMHMKDVGTARNRVAQGKHTETEGRVVAELMFGFWRLLHAKSYEHTLWTPCLRHAYPHQPASTRGEVYERLDRLNTVRNRIAHHEPIHAPTIGSTGRDLAGLHADLFDLLSWIDGDVAAWVSGRTRFPSTWARRP